MIAASDENQTIHDLVLPALGQAGWPAELTQREYPITGYGREVVAGRVRLRGQLRADLVLVRPSGHPIAAVEAKRSLRSVYDGVQQAKDYGRRLGLPIVYATNGRKIIEIDMRAGTQHEVPRYRSADELWNYYQQVEQLDELGVRLFDIPYSRAVVTGGTGEIKQMRYYQHLAAQALLRAIAAGDRRLLAVLATGTGKSMLAAQLVHVLWEANWPRGPQVPDPKPRVLYLADRDALLTDPMTKYFDPIFGADDIHRIQGAKATHTRIYFALYQALDSRELFSQYDRDWFDLVIVDECHRGSARDDSEWRGILDHFSDAVHLGLTATPRVDGEGDNLSYFGEPVYTYSLKQGISDGFLAPFQMIRAPLSSDVDGIYVPPGTLDEDGDEIPEGEYDARAFERTLILPERTEAAAAFLTDYLRGSDRMAKTVVFCVNQDHAARFTEAIDNLNSDLVAVHPDWGVRITSNEGDRGAALLERFKDGDEPTPVVVSSSDMLTTGVDIPNLRNVVFLTRVRSTARFKQMLGRGTRLDDERGKDYFTVIDFTGATAQFADPSFDGPVIAVHPADPGGPAPDARVPVDAADEDDDVHEPYEEFDRQAGGEFPPDGDGRDVIDDPDEVDDIRRRATRHVLRGQEIRVLGRVLYLVDTDHTLRLRAVRIEDWVRDRIVDLGYGAESLRRRWANSVSRSALTAEIRELLPMSLGELATTLGYPDAEPLDLLLHLAFDGRLRSRGERVASFTIEQRQFLDGFDEQARVIVDEVLRKYVAHGPDDLDARVLQVPPLSGLGSVTELAERFGGRDRLHAAFDELNARLYDAS